jgi:arylsulfatase A-like enzyme
MRSPNLLFVFPDQMRGQAMGFLNEEPVFTPHLDRFASQGLVLPNAVANYPVCSPYRAMLMTGKYAHSNHVISNCTNRSAAHGVELQETDRCWSDILRDQGYSLGYIGKWHLDAPHEPYIDCANNRGELKWNEWCPPHRRHGFDFWHAYGTYDVHTKPMYWHTDAPRDGFQYVDQWGPEHEADLAVEYIRNRDATYRDPDKPFALVVAMNPPHMPYNLVPDQYVDLYRHIEIEALCQRPNIPPKGTQWGDYYRTHIRNYYAMVSGVDEQFGRILAALDEQALAKDTIVVFTSDHGNCLGIHNLISKNNAYEESMRVPFIIRWPGHIEPRQDELLLSAPDVYPTLIELLGFGSDVPQDVEGTSYARLFVGKEMARPSSQLYMCVPFDNPSLGQRGVRTDRYTYVESKTADQTTEHRLYDTLNDPYQLEDVAGEQPDMVHRLADELAHWLTTTRDPYLAG